MRTHHIHIAAAVACIIATSAAAQAQAPHTTEASLHTLDASIRLRFVNTDVSDILQAISVKTHANIVFPAEMKKPVSINFAAHSTEEALGYVAAASGLAFRLIGKTYVVAPPADLRQALEPFGIRERLALNGFTADDAVKLLDGALPYLTARPAGNQVLVIGAEEDIAEARRLLAEQDKPLIADPVTSDVIVIKYTSASQVATMLKALYPTVRAETVAATDKVGGVLGIAGPHSAVESARQAIKTADVPTGDQNPAIIYRIYQIRYGSATTLRDFMEEAVPRVSTLIGPDSYSPPHANFNPLSSASLGSSGGGSSSGGSSTGGGGSSSGSTGGSESGGATGGGSGGGGASAPSSGGPAGGASGATGAPSHEDRAKVLVLKGTPPDLDVAFKLLESVDIQPKQVMVDVRVVDTTPQFAENLGVQWSWNPLNFIEGPAGTTVANAFNNTQSVSPGSISRVPMQINATINAMTTKNEAKILADPRIAVLDNDEASIFIGDTIRTQVSTASISGTTVQVLEFPVGIVLLVRPRVNADGKITMHIHPVVSTVTSVDANDLPQTSSREAETTVLVQDGETVVIGGLIRDEMSNVIQDVPFLSKLPLIGQLFHNRNTSKTHSDILVFITPHIMK